MIILTVVAVIVVGVALVRSGLRAQSDASTPAANVIDQTTARVGGRQRQSARPAR
ncbi:MAG: hypothetical protein U0521_05260 [Anaerolineae bacterium]